MISKIIIYVLIVLLLIVDRQTINLTDKIGFSKSSYYAILLFTLYLILLYIDLKPKIKKAVDLTFLKRRTLIFSFWIGAIWGVIMSFSGGFHYKIDPSVIFFMLLGDIFVGIIFALTGYLFLKILCGKKPIH